MAQIAASDQTAHAKMQTSVSRDAVFSEFYDVREILGK